jgi:pyruvate dehydrogenase (quinone)
MSEKVVEVLWDMLAKAGLKRCYGIAGDALNPGIAGLRRNAKIEFIHVRHEEYGAFAAVADAISPATQSPCVERLGLASCISSMD